MGMWTVHILQKFTSNYMLKSFIINYKTLYTMTRVHHHQRCFAKSSVKASFTAAKPKILISWVRLICDDFVCANIMLHMLFKAQNWSDWDIRVIMGLFLISKIGYVWVLFQISSGMSLPKPQMRTTPPPSG